MSRKHSKCPICGANARLLSIDQTEYHERKRAKGIKSKNNWSDIIYKASCKGCGVHISVGEWYPSKEKAWEDWERRTKDLWQRDPNNADEARRKYIMLINRRDERIAEIYKQYQKALDKCKSMIDQGEE